MSKLPKVVIVGRANVGKSTLFNRLSVNVKSLTLDFAGVTRDFLSDVITWKGIAFELVDSGGISFKKSQDSLTEKVRMVALSLVEKADLIVFVCDGKVGLLPEDRDINNFLRKHDKDVILAINKIDSHEAQEKSYEFEKLGYDVVVELSAQHGTGSGDLLDEIVKKVATKESNFEEEAPAFSIALIGKPNVGKSSLMNFLLEEERSIVDAHAGTTREAISERLRFYKETIQITDTPGIRRKRGVTELLETLMVKSSFRAVDKADIILLMIEGTEGHLSDQELKLAFYAFEHQKSLALLVNKEDLVTDQQRADFAYDCEKYKHLLKKIPVLTISCKTKKNCGKILPLVQKIWERANQSFSNQELTELFKNALEKTPLYVSSHRLLVRKVKQIRKAPLTFLLLVNEPKWFGDSQLAFFENAMRGQYDLVGVPLTFIPRKTD
jgi:GTP-binding protein